MPTGKLFHQDPYQTSFEARVVRCTPAGARWEVELDRTCFYAESGGQPSDSGTLGSRPVAAVRELEDGTILHEVDQPLDDVVEGVIAWDHRLDHMQQHTGQHLLSGVFEHLFEAETASWHLGTESCTVDLAIESLSPDQVDSAENECNRLIRSCLPVITHIADVDSVKSLPLRKAPVVDTDIRVVEIQGYDWSACAGTHVRNTGELGLIKIKSWEKNKRFTRVEFLVGLRAERDYAFIDRLTRNLCRSLSIGVADLPGFVERAQEESASLRKQVRSLQNQILELEAAELLKSARRVGGARVVRVVFAGRPLEEVKMLAAKVSAHPSTVAVFGTRGAVPQIFLSRSVDLRLDMGAILKRALPLIDGRGGGSPVQAQGGGSRLEALESALDQVLAGIAESIG